MPRPAIAKPGTAALVPGLPDRETYIILSASLSTASLTLSLDPCLPLAEAVSAYL